MQHVQSMCKQYLLKYHVYEHSSCLPNTDGASVPSERILLAIKWSASSSWFTIYLAMSVHYYIKCTGQNIDDYLHCLLRLSAELKSKVFIMKIALSREL